MQYYVVYTVDIVCSALSCPVVASSLYAVTELPCSLDVYSTGRYGWQTTHIHTHTRARARARARARTHTHHVRVRVRV